jgi:hypothetical protein
VGRGERLIKLGDSWFSAKAMDVTPRKQLAGGRALKGCGLPMVIPSSKKLRIPVRPFREAVLGCEGPRTRGKQPRPYAKVLKFSGSEKGV